MVLPRQWVIHVALPLLLGASIYLLTRPPDIRFVAAIFGNPLPEWLLAARNSELARTIAGNDFISLNLPDGLWAYAGIAFFCLLWRGYRTSVQITWLIVGVLIVAGSEAFQFFGLTEGTFDHEDVIAIALGIFFAIALLFQPNSGE